ncbi:unnamed protein product [Hymenolepis diminuta]|uniref:Uncharacterized protein n=1 Tax=Hymenolepis diminuta TaxID=6216 RepID=A0A564XX10_HYMDI|nr:unnamed protein product [Hymenolepis diminuta]
MSMEPTRALQLERPISTTCYRFAKLEAKPHFRLKIDRTLWVTALRTMKGHQ